MPLRIPDRERPRLARLTSVSARVRAAVLAALKKCSPTLDHKATLQQVVDALDGELDTESALDIVSFIHSLYWVRTDRNVTPAEMAASLRANAIRSDDPKLKNPEGGWDQLETFLVDVLSLDDTFGASAKALFLAYQAPRHYHFGRVITDARPVFTNSPDEQPGAFVVLHTLQVEFHENGEDREWFISMDADDLQNLKAAVDRAIEKQRSVSELLKKTGVPVHTWTET